MLTLNTCTRIIKRLLIHSYFLFLNPPFRGGIGLVAMITVAS